MFVHHKWAAPQFGAPILATEINDIFMRNHRNLENTRFWIVGTYSALNGLHK
jgi:hypothetical protein